MGMSEFAQHGTFNKPVKVMHPVVMTGLAEQLKQRLFSAAKEKDNGTILHSWRSAVRGRRLEGRSNN